MYSIQNDNSHKGYGVSDPVSRCSQLKLTAEMEPSQPIRQGLARVTEWQILANSRPEWVLDQQRQTEGQRHLDPAQNQIALKRCHDTVTLP